MRVIERDLFRANTSNDLRPSAKASFGLDSSIANPDRYIVTVGCFDHTREEIFNANDFGNRFCLGLIKHIFTGANLQQVALIQKADTIGESKRLVSVMVAKPGSTPGFFQKPLKVAQ